MSLDKQQVEAVVACEDAQLVLASAGSGKTMSLLAKIEYLVRELKIQPQKILAISFTKKTVDELIERCAIKNVEFRTFHALGNAILQEYQSEYLAKRRLISEAEIRNFLEWKLLEKCQNSAFARKVNDYILFYLSTPKAPGDFKNLKGKIQINRLFLRHEILADARKKQYAPIRSKEDELVANWLYVHQIDYLHRENVPNLKQKADFTLGGIYLDIFALDKNGNSLLGASYQKDVSARRKGYKRAKLKHLEIHSYEWGACVAFENLERNLRQNGIIPKRRDEQEILHTIQTKLQSE
jgi:DNA helicase-4